MNEDSTSGGILTEAQRENSFRRWHKQSRNSATETVRAATEAAAIMRKQDPERFPPTPHSWYQLKADDEDLGAPLLCAACFTRIDPEGSVRLSRHLKSHDTIQM